MQIYPPQFDILSDSDNFEVDCKGTKEILTVLTDVV